MTNSDSTDTGEHADPTRDSSTNTADAVDPSNTDGAPVEVVGPQEPTETFNRITELLVSTVPLDPKPTDLNIPRDWQFHLRYSEDEKELIFVGVMTRADKWTAKKFSKNSFYRKAIKYLFKQSRNFQANNSIERDRDTRVTSVHLPETPVGNLENEHWDGRLQYQAAEKKLTFQGVMGRWRKWRAKKLSNDYFYRRAINNLARESRYFFSNGEAFVWVFRWVLLLLAAKLFERIADGVYEVLKVHGTFNLMQTWIPQQLQPMVIEFSNLLQSWGIDIDEIQRGYLIGFLQFTVTILLLVRYFTCVIDPIWRAVGINKHMDFGKREWHERLKNTKMWTIVYVGLITSIEFFFLYHSAKAVAEVDHWLHFLFLLVLADIILFFLPNLGRTVYQLIRLVFALISNVRMYRWYKRGLKLGSIETETDEIKGIYEKSKLAIKSKYLGILKKLGSIWVDYFFWDIFDLLAIVAGLYLLKTHPGDKGKLLACVVVATLTVMISALNLFFNRHVYHTHISVLKLGKA